MHKLFGSKFCGNYFSFLSFIFFPFLLASCKKDITPSNGLNEQTQKTNSPVWKVQGSGSGTGYCWEDAEDGSVADSVLKPTILGARLIGNPYSVANMSQALRNLTNSTAGVAENA